MMNRTSRIAARVGACLAIVATLVTVLAVAFAHYFYPEAPPDNFPRAESLAEQQRQDFEYFRHYLDFDRAYSTAARDEARRQLVANEARAGTLDGAQFELAIARMVALADNGHSRVSMGPLSRRHDRLPCRFYHFADGYRIIRARPACQAFLGTKVVALDGIGMGDIADRMFVFAGGPRNHYDQFISPFFLESPELLHAAGLAADAHRVSLRVVLPDGYERDVAMDADPPDADAPRVYSDSYLSPERIEKEPADWRALLAPDAKLPLFLRDYRDPFRSEFLPDSRAYYVQFRSNNDEPGHPIGDFVTHVREEVKATRPQFIVLDLRLDQGGNFVSTASLMREIAGLADSVRHVYVLTGPWTFSAGIVSLALVKEHAAAKVTVIGERPGDRIRLWAEGGTMTLPNSRLLLGFATGLHDYSHPCIGERGCFWTLFFFPTHLSTLDPDIGVAYRFDDYAGLRDPVMEKVLALVRDR